MNINELYSYLAGIIDGEGSLMIRKNKARKECYRRWWYGRN